MNTSPLVTIGIVLYKGEHYLPYCLHSLLSQTYTNFELLLRDQSPHAEAKKYIEKSLPEVMNDSRVRLTAGDNKWHSGGHNALIHDMKGQYYLCASNDMWYSENFLQTMVEEMEKKENKKYGSATGKLYRWAFHTIQNTQHNAQNFHSMDREKKGYLIQPSITNTLDSCGIGMLENHHFFDQGQGQGDEGQFDTLTDIFGPSGALGLYRKTALEKIQYKQEYFDELIHYKNDIDMAYRLQWAGQKCLFISDAHVWHDRQVSNKEGSMGLVRKIIQNWKSKPLWVKESSFFGHLVLLYKNFFGRTFATSTKIFVWWYIFRAVVFLLFTAPKVLFQIHRFWKEKKMINTKKNAMNISSSAPYISSLFLKP